jgi:predicted membrane metal-binding protein
MSLDTSSLINEYGLVFCGALLIFLVGVFLATQAVLLKRVRRIEAQLSELSGAVHQLKQLESRRFLISLKSDATRAGTSREDPSSLSIVSAVADINSPTARVADPRLASNSSDRA